MTVLASTELCGGTSGTRVPEVVCADSSDALVDLLHTRDLVIHMTKDGAELVDHALGPLELLEGTLDVGGGVRDRAKHVVRDGVFDHLAIVINLVLSQANVRRGLLHSTTYDRFHESIGIRVETEKSNRKRV